MTPSNHTVPNRQSTLVEWQEQIESGSGVAAAPIDDFQTGSGIANGREVGVLIGDLLFVLSLLFAAWVIGSRLAAGAPDSVPDWVRFGWTVIRALMMPAILAVFIESYN